MKATLPKFGHDVLKLFDYMTFQMNEIIGVEANHDDFTLNIVNALETTVNDEFRAFIVNEKNKWETSDAQQDDHVVTDQLIQIVTKKYNNMAMAKKWVKSENPSSKIITAMATKLQTLENKLNRKSEPSARLTNSGG